MPLRPFRSRESVVAATRESENRKAIADLVASRRAIAEAYEVERRRIERDLHDGTQQHLVAALMCLGEAQLSASLDTDPQLRDLLARAKAAVSDGLASLRATVHGIHPHALTDLGLEAAIRDLASTGAGHVTVTCPHPLPPLPQAVTAAAYFFAAEAVTNAVKYAPGAPVNVALAADRSLHVSVVDDGPGGAHLAPGHGLAGLRERLATFGGELSLSSPPGGPTTVAARIPLLLRAGESGIGTGVEGTP